MNREFEKWWLSDVWVSKMPQPPRFPHAYAKPLAKLAYEAAQPQWQPIETAPKVIRVLIYVPTLASDGVFSWTNDSECPEWIEGATHWMPIPEPPTN